MKQHPPPLSGRTSPGFILTTLLVWFIWALLPAYAGDPPMIVQQPQSIMVPIGETLRLSCVVTGTPPIAYIWQRDDVFLNGQTNATLTITNAQPADSGRYRLTASNDDGLARSTNADVVVYTNHQCDFPPSWAASPDSGLSAGEAKALLPDGAGNLYVAGYSADAATLLKYDRTGKEVWVARSYLSPRLQGDYWSAITLDTHGNVVVAGHSYYENAGPPLEFRLIYTVAKYTPDGTELWANRFTNSCGTTGNVWAFKVGTDEHDDVYVVGHVGVVKYTSGGEFVWSNCGPHYSSAWLGVLTNGLGYYVASTTYGPASALGVARCDPNGATVWSTNTTFGGATVESEGGGAFAVDGSNNFCLAVTVNADIVVGKFALDGTLLWTQRYDGPYGPDKAGALAVDGSGNIIVVGASWTSPLPPQSPSDYSGFDIRVLKYAPDGTLLWSSSYGAAPGMEDEGDSVATDPGGNIYVAGVTAGSATDQSQRVILKYSPEGTLLWRMRRGSLYGQLLLATDTAGDLFAAGGDRNTPSYSRLTAMKLGQSEPRLAVCTGLQGGWFHGSLVSPRGTQFEILGNTNLLSGDWQRVWTVTNFNGLVPFYDPQAGQHPMRFYRAKEVSP